MLRTTSRATRPGVRIGVLLFAMACVAGTFLGVAVRDLPAAEGAPLLVLGLLFVGAGVVASTRRPDNVTGGLLSLTGLAWLLAVALTTVDQRLIYTVGLALFPLGLAPLGHLAVAFPHGRSSSRLERALVVAPYVLGLASFPIVGAASCQDCPASPVGLGTASGLGRLWYSTLLVAVLLTSVGVVTVLVRRWRGASPAGRRVLLPVVPGACVFGIVYAGAILTELGVPTGLGERWALVGLVLLASAPLVFLGGLLRARLARGGVGELVVELGGSSSRDGLRDAIAGALGDPSVEVAYWIPERNGYVEADGTPLDLPTGGRSVAVVEREGRRVGALVFDPAVRDDPALVDAVAAAAGLVMENERLHAEVLARLEEVRASRARIVEAADIARRRVERNLHDGAQQRLVSLTLAVGMARARLGNAPDPALDDLLREASDQAGLALGELRELGQGLHPAVLSEAGLVAAIESLAERSTVPVEIVADIAGCVPPAVEVAAYYVVSEALANVAKHAQASSGIVHVTRKGDRLVVEIGDDGRGGAEVRPGSGLEGLADRVAALDGRLGVESPPGRGTRVWVDLPCG